MEKVTLDWPQLKKNSNPASVIFAQDFLVTRDERANAFAVIKLSGGESAKAKEQLVFDALKTPIACWTLHEGSDTLFVAHTDFSLQVYYQKSGKTEIFLSSEMFDDEKAAEVNEDDSPQVAVASDKHLCLVSRRGVYVWKRMEASIEPKPSFISFKGLVKVFDDSHIEGDELFVCTATTFVLFDLAKLVKKPLFEWTESLGQFFKFAKLDRIVVGVKFSSLVMWNLVEKTRKEVNTDAFISALVIDQSFLITGDSDGKIQLRNPVTGDVTFKFQSSSKDESEIDDALDDTDARARQGAVAKEYKAKPQKGKKKKEEKDDLVVDLTQRVNQLERVGRYLVAAHQDKVVTIWDINKSTKRPVALLNHAGPVRSIGIEGETIFSGSLIVEQLVETKKSKHRKTHTLASKSAVASHSASRSGSRREADSKVSDSKVDSNSDTKKSSDDATRTVDSMDLDSKKTASVDGSSPTNQRRTPERARVGKKLLASVEHIKWVPDIPWFDKESVKPVHLPRLPLPLKDFEGKEMQEVLESFPTVIDWWEYQVTLNDFTILVFYRGLWQDGTYCCKYLKRWHKICAPIIALGGKLIALTCDTPENAKESHKRWDLPKFDIVSDPSLLLANHLHLVISKGPKDGKSLMFPQGMHEAAVFIVTNKRKALFKWTSTPNFVNDGGGRGRPDPFDTWLFVGNKVLRPNEQVPLTCKIHLGCPATHMGWKNWGSKDIHLLPGADRIHVNILQRIDSKQYQDADEKDPKEAVKEKEVKEAKEDEKDASKTAKLENPQEEEKGTKKKSRKTVEKKDDDEEKKAAEEGADGKDEAKEKIEVDQSKKKQSKRLEEKKKSEEKEGQVEKKETDDAEKGKEKSDNPAKKKKQSKRDPAAKTEKKAEEDPKDEKEDSNSGKENAAQKDEQKKEEKKEEKKESSRKSNSTSSPVVAQAQFDDAD